MGERIAQLDNLPFLHLSSPISDIPQLKNYDIVLNLPFEHNFNYYCTNEFCNDYDIKQCWLDPITFSVLNCNIWSLAANFDNLHNMLIELNFPFSLIGLTETKFRRDIEHVTNVDMPGYDLISQPSLSNTGGVAFYNITYFKLHYPNYFYYFQCRFWNSLDRTRFLGKTKFVVQNNL